MDRDPDVDRLRRAPTAQMSLEELQARAGQTTASGQEQPRKGYAGRRPGNLATQKLSLEELQMLANTGIKDEDKEDSKEEGPASGAGASTPAPASSAIAADASTGAAGASDGSGIE